MPISEKQEAALKAIEVETGVAKAPTPKTADKSTSKTPLQISYPTLTDDKLSQLFGDNDDVTKDFKYLMNGMDDWSRNAIINKGVYGQSKVYFGEAKSAAMKVADYYTANIDKLYSKADADKFNAEINRLTKDYATKHTLANISLSTVIGDKQKAQFIKGQKPVTRFGENREGSNLVFDHDERKIVTKKYLEEKNETVYRGVSVFTDLKTKKNDPWYTDLYHGAQALSNPGSSSGIQGMMSLMGYGDMSVEQDIDATAGYKAFYKGTQNRPKEVDYRLNYFMKNWATQSVFLMGQNQISKFEKKSDYYTNMNKTRGFVNDILVAAKDSKNPEIQRFASKLNKGLAENKGDWKGTIEFIRENGNDISSIVNHKEFSYYAKERLYNKYKTVYDDTKYIHDPENKMSREFKASVIDKYSSQLDLGLKTLKEQRADYKLAKEEAIRTLGSTLEGSKGTSTEKLFHSTMFYGNGDPKSYDKWIKEFPEDGRKSKLYTPAVQKFNQTLADIKATGKYNAMMARKLATDRLSDSEKAELNQYGAVYNFNQRHDLFKGPSNYDLKGHYNSFKNKYKEQFNTLDFTQSFTRGAMENGMGANGIYALEQREINFKRGTSKKAVNASELIAKVQKSLETGESDMVVVNRAWSKLDSKSDFNGISDKDNLATINNFFKDKDKSNFNLTYVNKYKDPGSVVYIFKNLTTNKELSISMPKATAKGMKEAFAMAEYDDSDDFHFKLKGEKDLKNYHSMGTSKPIKYAKIYQDSGDKIFEAEIDVWNEAEQKFLPEKFIQSLGPSQFISIDDATNASLIWLKEYEKQIAEFKK